MAGEGTPPAVYNARLRRVVFANREQHESDLRWVIFARNNHNLSNGKEKSPPVAPAAVAPLPPTGGSFYVGMDSRDARRTVAHQTHIDAALRSVIDLPSLRQY